MSTSSARSLRLLAWSRALFVVAIVISAVMLAGPLVTGLLGWNVPWSGLWVLLIVCPLVAIGHQLRHRADPVFDQWPWNRRATPPADDETDTETAP